MVQVVEQLSSKCKALSSNPTTAKNNSTFQHFTTNYRTYKTEKTFKNKTEDSRKICSKC
jgi:hypothetical protein